MNVAEARICTYLSQNLVLRQLSNPMILGVHLLEEVLLVFVLDYMVKHVIGGPPRGLTTLQTAGVHWVSTLVFWVPILPNVLKPRCRLCTLSQLLL